VLRILSSGVQGPPMKFIPPLCGGTTCPWFVSLPSHLK